MEDSHQLFRRLCEGAGFSPRSYNGRGMYGKNCLGVTLDHGQSFGELTAALIREARTEEDADAAFDAIEEAFDRTSQDAMGLGTIIYFPGMDWEGDESPECEECGKRISNADVGAYRANGGTGDPATCEDCAEDAAESAG